MGRCVVKLLAAALCGSLLFAGPLTIYTEISPPDQFLGSDGQPTGYSCEVVREIQRRIGNTDPIKVVPWIRGYHKIQERPNVVLFSMARSKDRDPLFQWVGPIRETVYNFYARADSGIVIESLEDAKKLKLIGVYREDSRDQYLSKLGFTNLDRSIDNLTILKKLMDGRIDCMIGAATNIGPNVKAAGFKQEQVREVYSFLKVQLYIAFSKATPAATVELWDRTLHTMRQDGSFERIFHLYFPDAALPGPALKPY